MNMLSDSPSPSSETAKTMERAKQLAERVVSSMRQQGFQDIEYILTECQLKVVASASGKAPRTQYLSMPTSSFADPESASRDVPRRRFVL